MNLCCWHRAADFPVPYVTGRWKQISAALCGRNRCVSRRWPFSDPGGRAARLMRCGCVYVTHRHSHCRYTRALTHSHAGGGATDRFDLLLPFAPSPDTYRQGRRHKLRSFCLAARRACIALRHLFVGARFPIRLSLRNFRVTELVGRNLSLYSVSRQIIA